MSAATVFSAASAVVAAARRGTVKAGDAFVVLIHADDHATVAVLAGRPAGHALDLHNGGVNDAALVGVHGLERVVTLIAQRLGGDALGQRRQRILSLLAVVAGIEGDAEIASAALVAGQRGQILQGIQRLAVVADDVADVLTLKGKDGTVGFLLDLKADVQLHAVQQRGQVCGGSVQRGAFDVGAHLGVLAAEQTQGFFLGLHENIKFYIGILADTQGRFGGFDGVLQGLAGSDCFTNHDDSS